MPFTYHFSDYEKKKFKKSFWKTLNQPKNPTRWIFFGEKAILEESNKPSLGKIR